MTEPVRRGVRLKLAEIEWLPALRIRDGLDEETVEKYADLWRSGYAEFPPIGVAIIEGMGGSPIGVYGEHRCEGRARAGFDDVVADVYEVDFAKALELALRENSKHPLAMRKRDVARAIELIYRNEDLKRKSLREIGEMVGVSYEYVRQIRNKLVEMDRVALAETVHGLDGKTYRPTVRERKREAASAKAEGAVMERPEGVAGRIEAHDAAIASWCAAIAEGLEHLPDSPWVDQGVRQQVEVQLKAAAALVRVLTARGPHEACGGEGCGGCRGTGFLPRRVAYG